MSSLDFILVLPVFANVPSAVSQLCFPFCSLRDYGCASLNARQRCALLLLMIQVQANDPEVEEFKRKTGYDYVHRRFKVSDARNSVGDRGSMRYRKLENAVVCGTIRVSHRNDMTARCLRGLSRV